MEITIETGLDTYVVTEVIGEGGASRVYGATDSAGRAVAIKLLKNANTDKRRRFKNEMSFLYRNRHPNIVAVEDTGFADDKKLSGPFYVMKRYTRSLRDLMNEDAVGDERLAFFSQILDGVEAAHLKGVVHRDIKPENILYDRESDTLSIADFGIAHFNEDAILTAVETGANDRLANFQYAAPEQRVRGRSVSAATDIYALGLVLNEIFTGEIAQGEDYAKISDISEKLSFLDSVVSAMIKQRPEDRPQSLREVKAMIQRFEFEAVQLQKISEIDSTVIQQNEIDDPLALEPPEVTAAEYVNGNLEITFDQPLSSEWMVQLRKIGNFQYMGSVHPHRVELHGNQKMIVRVDGNHAQRAMDMVKTWLPTVSKELFAAKKRRAKQEEFERRDRLEKQRRREAENLAVTSSLKI